MELPETIGLATLADLAGVTERRIQQLAQGGVIPVAKRGLYACADSIKALFSHYRSMAGSNKEELAAEKLSKAKSDAIIAAVGALEAMDKVILCSDAEALWDDASVRVRATIEGAKYLEAEQKDRLFRELEAIKLATEEEDED